jgi:hypothetical protein
MHNLVTGRRAAICAAVAVVSVGGLAGAALALPSAPHSSTIHACASKSSGALRLASHCKSRERAVSWSQTGPRGPQGPSNGYANSILSQVSVSSAENLTSVRLPRGSYLMFATSTAVNANNIPVNFDCALNLGTGTKEVSASSTVTDQPDASTQESLSLAATIKSTEDLVLLCNSGTAETFMENTRIEAIQVGKLTIPPPS